MKRKLLFVDRDGCLIVEPPDEQIDSFDKLDLVSGVIAALQRCVAAGYELVMVTNQDGLGTESFPEAAFRGPQELLLRILASQGICFREILIDRSFDHRGLDTRKPGTGLLRHYLADDGCGHAVAQDHAAVPAARPLRRSCAANALARWRTRDARTRRNHPGRTHAHAHRVGRTGMRRRGAAVANQFSCRAVR